MNERVRSARHLCVVLHDVAPARMAHCRAVLARTQRLAREAGVTLPVTLLVVPRWHGDPQLPRGYLHWLHALVRDGHELALHGYTHLDEAPAPRGPLERLVRHAYTAGEGEFAALTRLQAESRIARARAWAVAHELPTRGFVAPAWLASAGAREAVAAAGFDYTCTLTRVLNLEHATELHSHALVFSTRSAWRRALSVGWNTLLARLQHDAPLMRFELHPDDIAHAAVARCWTRALAAALRERQALRLADVAELASEAPAYRGG